MRPKNQWWFLVIPLVVMVSLLGTADPPPQRDRTTVLIANLGAANYEVREAAVAELKTLGEPILPLLRKTAMTHPDPEIRLRAEATARSIIFAHRKSKSTGLESIRIAPGVFEMGSPGNEGYRRADETQHKVEITREFLLGKYEVTQDEYHTVMKARPSWFSPTGSGKDSVNNTDTGKFPVERVSWYDAVTFCNKLSELDGYEPYYKITDSITENGSIKDATVSIKGGRGYRLPTEAEWEYAARAGSATPFFYGYGMSNGREANIKPIPSTGYGGGPSWATLNRTAKVGTHGTNAWGFCDMVGNVGEWVWDRYGATYYREGPEKDPPGPIVGLHQSIRGGSWLVTESSGRSASRYWLQGSEYNFSTGFRVARTP